MRPVVRPARLLPHDPDAWKPPAERDKLGKLDAGPRMSLTPDTVQQEQEDNATISYFRIMML